MSRDVHIKVDIRNNNMVLDGVVTFFFGFHVTIVLLVSVYMYEISVYTCTSGYFIVISVQIVQIRAVALLAFSVLAACLFIK